MNTKYFEEENADFIRERRYLDDFVLPDYDKLNVGNISSLIKKIFNTNSLGSTKIPENFCDDSNGVERVFLIIVDGLGFKRLLTHISRHDGLLAEIAQKGVLKSLTTTFPATTSTALTSIFTGMHPCEHRVLGYQMFSREHGCVFNTLDMKPIFGYTSRMDIASDFILRIKPWTFQLQEHGIRALMATKATIVGSGLSRVIHAGQEYVPYMLDSEMMVKCRKAIELDGRTLLSLYYSGIDALEHRYGTESEEVVSEIQSFEYHLKNLIEKLSSSAKKNTMIILTSDHGMVDVSRVYYVKDHDQIAKTLMLPPVGDSRSTFFFTESNAAENLQSAFQKHVEGFRLLSSKKLVENGAFGRPADPLLLEGLTGDFTALSNSQNVLQYPFFDEDRNREFLGAHGGMTADEVIVPLLSLRLSKI